MDNKLGTKQSNEIYGLSSRFMFFDAPFKRILSNRDIAKIIDSLYFYSCGITKYYENLDIEQKILFAHYLFHAIIKTEPSNIDSNHIGYVYTNNKLERILYEKVISIFLLNDLEGVMKYGGESKYFHVIRHSICQTEQKRK